MQIIYIWPRKLKHILYSNVHLLDSWNKLWRSNFQSSKFKKKFSVQKCTFDCCKISTVIQENAVDDTHNETHKPFVPATSRLQHRSIDFKSLGDFKPPWLVTGYPWTLNFEKSPVCFTKSKRWTMSTNRRQVIIFIAFWRLWKCKQTFFQKNNIPSLSI